MAWITKKVAKCELPGCGHEWIPKPSKLWLASHTKGEEFIPVHCGSSKCKSRLWNGSTRTEKKSK